jgi:hypothetical protein
MADKDGMIKALNDDVLGMTRDINAILESTDFGVRARFREHFQKEQAAVSGATAAAASMLSVFTAWLQNDDIDRIRVLGMLNTSLILQLSSFKLFMFGAAPVRWTVYRLRFLISSPSILHPQRSLPPQAAEALGEFFLQSATNRPRIKLQAPRSSSTPGVGIPTNSTLRRFCTHDHAARLAA